MQVPPSSSENATVGDAVALTNGDAAPPDAVASTSDLAPARRRSTRRTPDQPCLNCGDTTEGDYCRSCGQPKRKVVVSVRNLIRDVLEDQLVLSMKLPRTLLLLITKPGFLTTEYVNGRIVRYVAPFRLYLASSVVFFLLLSFLGLRAFDAADLDDLNVTRDSAQVLNPRAAINGAIQALDTTELPVEAREAVAAAVNQVQTQVDGARSNTASGDSAQTSWWTRPGLQPWAVTISRDGDDGELVRRMVEHYGHLPGRDAIRAFMQDFLEFAPHMVFLLLPVFALLLKLLYVRRKRFYAEHFVFALHTHAFTFLVAILMFVIGNAVVNSLLFFGVMLYAWLAMKRVYAQGWVRTTAKYWILGYAYLMLLTCALIGTMLVTVMLG